MTAKNKAIAFLRREKKARKSVVDSMDAKMILPKKKKTRFQKQKNNQKRELQSLGRIKRDLVFESKF